jgi:predicted Zn finger-like uncharacterized protein
VVGESLSRHQTVLWAVSVGTCPSCGVDFDVEDAEAGLLFRAVVCPECHEAFPAMTED